MYIRLQRETPLHRRKNPWAILLAALLEKTALLRKVLLPSYFNFNPTGETRKSRRKFL
jgi:hypothetical protein